MRGGFFGFGKKGHRVRGGVVARVTAQAVRWCLIMYRTVACRGIHRRDPCSGAICSSAQRRNPLQRLPPGAHQRLAKAWWRSVRRALTAPVGRDAHPGASSDLATRVVRSQHGAPRPMNEGKSSRAAALEFSTAQHEIDCSHWRDDLPLALLDSHRRVRRNADPRICTDVI